MCAGLALISSLSHADDAALAAREITLDVGNRDSLVDDNKALHETLDRFGIANTFEVYDGDHGSGVVSRFETRVLPFFSRHLQF